LLCISAQFSSTSALLFVSFARGPDNGVIQHHGDARSHAPQHDIHDVSIYFDATRPFCHLFSPYLLSSILPPLSKSFI
jgi:hypothetical protein